MTSEPFAASFTHEAPAPAQAADPKAVKILAASRGAFLELGYGGTSMDLVAQRARVSKTTLYTRFPSKEELFVATITAECDRYGLRFAPDAFDGLPLEETLARVGRRFVDLLWSPDAIRMQQAVIGEATRFPEVARLYHQAGPAQAIAGFAGLFERLAGRGLARVEDPVFTAVQFLAALKGGPHCGLELGLCGHPPEDEREAFVRKAVALFVRGIA